MNTQDIAFMDEMARKEDGEMAGRSCAPTAPVDGKEGDGKEKKTISKALVELAKGDGMLFNDGEGIGFISLKNKCGGDTILGIESSEFRKMLAYRYYKVTGNVVSDKSLHEAIMAMAGESVYECGAWALTNRVAWRGDSIVYDMSDENCQEIVIDESGWSMNNKSVPTFRSWAHQTGQVPPVHGGDIEEMFTLLNVVEEDKLLTLVHMVSSLIPDIPHPMIVVGGEQGSAKSTASRFLKSLIDPSTLKTSALPHSADRINQMLSKHWYIIMDNVSYLEKWQSDMFCCAVTGQAAATRKLFTDTDDQIFAYKMCLGLNGITSLVTEGDLLDRTLNIRFAPVTRNNRRSETSINKIFDELKPRVLGAMFDIVSKAMVIEKDLEIDDLPRMADFVRWGCAITIALGYDMDKFMSSYQRLEDDGNQDALESEPVAELIQRFMADKSEWEGTSRELRYELKQLVIADDDRIGEIRGMKNPTALGRARDRIAPILRRVGITWNKLERTRNRRGHKITNMSCHVVADGTPLYVYQKEEENIGVRGRHIGGTCQEVPNVTSNHRPVSKPNVSGNVTPNHTVLPPSNSDDFDANTANIIRTAIKELVLKSNGSDGCGIDDIVRACPRSQPSVIHKHLTVYFNKLNIEKVNDNYYKLRD